MAAMKSHPRLDHLAEIARGQPDEPAVIDDRPDGSVTRLSWADFNAYVNRIANGFLALGVEPLDRLAWCGKNSIATLAITHAARKIGAITVPLNYRLTAEEMAYLVENSDASTAWVEADFAPRVAEIRSSAPALSSVVVFDGEPAPQQLDEESFLGGAGEPNVDVPPEGVPSMIYTSGTTGRPKGALRNGNGDPRQRDAMLELVGFARGDVYITTGPLYHNGPNNFAMVNMRLGNTVVLQRRFDAEDWLRLVDKYGVSSTFSAPTPIRRICNLPEETKAKYDTSSMRVLLANAAPWPFSLKKAYVRDFPGESLWEGYGATEIGVTTLLAPEDQMRKPGSCGKPAPFVDIRLLDDVGNQILEPHVPGEIYVNASSVVGGYHKDQEAWDREQLGDYHTVGDIAYFDDEGYYYICDRRKDMIISGGVNIYPAEIENVLEGHPGIYESAVLGVPDEEWGESVHAVVVAKEGGLEVSSVVDHARQHLAGFKVPRSVEIIDEIPKTGSGKILKREIRKRLAGVASAVPKDPG